jgi:hypothetical protein
VLEDLLVHRYDNAYGMEVETSIQNRQLSDAFEALVKLSRTEFSKDQQLAKDEVELIKHCSIRPPIENDSWEIGTYNACTFSDVKKDLIDFCYGLPPGFGKYSQWTDIIPDNIQRQFGHVLLRQEVVSEIKKGNWEIIIKREAEIIKGIECDLDFLDFETTSLIIETCLSNSFLKGLTIGAVFGKVLAYSPKFKFDNISHLMHLFVFPTVFDQYDWIPNNDTKIMDQRSETRQKYIKKHLDILQKEREQDETPVIFDRNKRKHYKRHSGILQKEREQDETPVIIGRNSSKRVGGGLKSRTTIKEYEIPEKKMLFTTMTDGKIALPMVSLELYGNINQKNVKAIGITAKRVRRRNY